MIFSIGSFDGYHRGHCQLFSAAQEMSARLGVSWQIVTFSPHPRKVLGNGLDTILFSEEEKKFIRQFLHLPEPIVIQFTLQFAAEPPEKFLADLDLKWGVDGIVVGDDFHFGKDKTGNGKTLERVCRSRGWKLALIPQLLSEGGLPISSSRIREMLDSGRVSTATDLLGYPFFMMSQVRYGQQRGRNLGFPTANFIPEKDKKLPAEGVYAGAALLEKSWIPAAISVGRNPTFLTDGILRVEVHLIQFCGDLYGKTFPVAFLERLRPIVRFAGARELCAQMKIDCGKVVQTFRDQQKQLVRLIPSS